jgi:hypothetical protein
MQEDKALCEKVSATVSSDMSLKKEHLRTGKNRGREIALIIGMMTSSLESTFLFSSSSWILLPQMITLKVRSRPACQIISVEEHLVKQATMYRSHSKTWAHLSIYPLFSTRCCTITHLHRVSRESTDVQTLFR